jgi:hypothetical protein
MLVEDGTHRPEFCEFFADGEKVPLLEDVCLAR